MTFKDEIAIQFSRLKKKYKLTTLEAISQIMIELSFLVEVAPDREYEKEEIELLEKQKIERRKEVKSKWRERNRQSLAEYAKDYRVKYCGQKS